MRGWGTKNERKKRGGGDGVKAEMMMSVPVLSIFKTTQLVHSEVKVKHAACTSRRHAKKWTT